MNKLKKILDNLVEKYESKSFIDSDPIKFLHKHKSKQDIEISGLISSSLAYGKREAFIEKLNYIHQLFGTNPYKFCLNLNQNLCKEHFKDFKYRFNTGSDICCLLEKLHKFYNENLSIDDFLKEKLNTQTNLAKKAITILSQELCNGNFSKSYCYLFPNPEANSACKRLNLFFKWMVRKSPVDMGIWTSLSSKDLIIPLDVHVAKVSRALNFTKRKTNDWQTAEEITAKLREFDPNDPVKYDFALFDIGIEKLSINL